MLRKGLKLNALQGKSSDSASKRTNFSVFILECADKKYCVGYARTLKKFMALARTGLEYKLTPEKLPAKLVFWEKGLTPAEAEAKYRYLSNLHQIDRERVAKKKCWYYGRTLLKHFDESHVEWEEEEKEMNDSLEEFKTTLDGWHL